MSLWSAGSFLVVTSGRNRVRRMVQRLREPRYLVGTALAGFYLYTAFLRAFMFHGERLHMELPASMVPFIEAGVFALALVVIGGAWVFGSDKPTLQFTEAEIQLLFPAPVTRRQVLHFKLARGILRIVFTAAVAGFFATRSGFARPAFVIPAGFFAFGTMWLHLTAVSFARAGFVTQGRFGLTRRIGTALAVIAGVGVLLHARHLLTWPPPTKDFAAVSAYLANLLQTPPLGILVYPVHVLVRMAFAPDLAGFCRWLPFAVGLFALHYLWVIRSDQAFEDGAIASAEHRAKVKETMALNGRRAPLSSAKIGRPWFALKSHGPSAYALTWKNLVASQRMFGLTLVLLLLSMAFPAFAASIGIADSNGESSTVILLGGASALFAVFIMIGGPLVLRADLRSDIPQFEILRALPLSGRQVIWGEVAGPWFLLVILQISLALGGLLVTVGTPSKVLPVGLRLAVVGGFVLLGPAVTMAVLLVQNAAAVLFPAWMVKDVGQPRGIEVLGQRLLNLVGTMLVLALGLAPAGLCGLLVYFLSRLVHLPTSGIFLGALIAAAILAAEAFAAIILLGRAFETADPTEL